MPSEVGVEGQSRGTEPLTFGLDALSERQCRLLSREAKKCLVWATHLEQGCSRGERVEGQSSQ